MEKLNHQEVESVQGGALLLSCCSIDLGIMTLKYDAFELVIGQDFSADYGPNLSSAYNRL